MFFYRLLSLVLVPVLALRLGWRVLRGAEPSLAFRERLGGGEAAPPGGLWLHAASNGELASARPLIDALFDEGPELRLLITTNTVTARQMALGWAQQDWARGRIIVRAAPLDARWVLRRFLTRLRPATLVVIENELWPNRMQLCAATGLPVFVIGARMSARSAARWRRTGLGPGLMSAITALSAQDPASEASFLALGLAPEKLLPIVNLKTAVEAPAATETLGWPRHQTVLAASTHEGEEEIVLEAFVAARQRQPDLRLILAPRHPRRAAEIARMITARGLSYATRSKAEAADQPVLLADTMGEMANWYASAGICFVGATLVPKGGHTPFEPVAYGCAILHGGSVSNHAAAFEALDRQGGARLTPDRAALTEGFLMQAAEQDRLATQAGRALAALSAAGQAHLLAANILSRCAKKA